MPMSVRCMLSKAETKFADSDKKHDLESRHAWKPSNFEVHAKGTFGTTFEGIPQSLPGFILSFYMYLVVIQTKKIWPVYLITTNKLRCKRG